MQWSSLRDPLPRWRGNALGVYASPTTVTRHIPTARALFSQRTDPRRPGQQPGLVERGVAALGPPTDLLCDRWLVSEVRHRSHAPWRRHGLTWGCAGLQPDHRSGQCICQPCIPAVHGCRWARCRRAATTAPAIAAALPPCWIRPPHTAHLHLQGGPTLRPDTVGVPIQLGRVNGCTAA